MHLYINNFWTTQQDNMEVSVPKCHKTFYQNTIGGTCDLLLDWTLVVPIWPSHKHRIHHCTRKISHPPRRGCGCSSIGHYRGSRWEPQAPDNSSHPFECSVPPYHCWKLPVLQMMVLWNSDLSSWPESACLWLLFEVGEEIPLKWCPVDPNHPVLHIPKKLF